MPLFERYVLRRTARGFLLILGALTVTLWIAQIMDDLDVVTAKGQAIWVFLVMTLLAMPALIQVIAPIAFMVGAIASLNSLATDSELPVIAGAGASRKAVIRPLLALGIVVTVGAALAHHVLTPASLDTLRTLLTRMQTQMVAMLVQEGGFRSVSDGLTMHVQSEASDGSLRGIFIDDQRDPNISVQYTAEQGVLLQEAGTAYLVLQRGDMIRNDRSKGENNVIAFQTYALDLSQIGGRRAAGYRAKERSTLYLLNVPADDPLLKDNPAQVASEIHDRMTAPLYPIAFALISLAFLGRPRTHRQDRNWAIASAVLLCVSLRVAGVVAVQLAQGSKFGTPFMYLIPTLSIVIGGYAAIRETTPQLPRPVSTLLDAAGAAGLRLFRPSLAEPGLAGTDRP